MMSAWRAFFERLMSRQHRSRKEKGTELPSTAQEPDSFRDFAVSASDWTWEIGADFRFIHISDKFPEITGIAKEDILGKTREELGADLIEPEALARYLDDLNNHRPFKNFEYALQSMQGCTLYASVSGIPVFDEQGGFMGYRGTGTDITGMKRLQLGLIRTARLYKTISATAAAVVRARSEQELLSELCRLSVEVGGYRRVSVGLSEDAEQDGMRLVAAHGEELTPLDLTERFVGPAGLGDSAHEAVRTGQPCVVRSDACESALSASQETARGLQRGAEAAFPLSGEGRVLGAIRFHSLDAQAFDDDEIQLLRGLADNLAYGMVSLRRSIAVKLVEHRLHEAIEAISEGFVIYDKNDRLVLCNERYREIYSFSRPVLVPGKTFEEVIRHSVEHGQITDAVGREEDYIRRRLAAHLNPAGPIVQELSDGRWIRIEERKTRDGGIVGIRLDITQLKNVEKHLRLVNEQLEQRVAERTLRLAELNDRLLTAEEKSRTIIESAADGIIVLGTDGIIQLFSPAAQKMFGYAEEEMLGRSVNLLMAEDSRSKHDGYMKNSEMSETIIGMARVVLGRRKDASIFPMEVAISRSVVGGEKLYTGIVRDISSRERAELSLRESEFRLDAALNGADLGWWDIDLTADRSVVNARWAEMMGVAHQDCQDPLRQWTQVLHPEDRDRVLRVGDYYRRGLLNAYEVEYRTLSHQGNVRWLLSRGVAISRDAKGWVQRMVLTMQDITDRKHDEQKIAEVMARLQTLLSATPVVIYTASKQEDLAMTYISPNVLEHMGWHAEQFTQDASFWLDNIHPDDRQRLLAERSGMLARARDFYEYRFRFGDGSYHWLHDDVRLRCDDRGVPVEVVGAWMDITERKHAEEKVRAADKAKSAFLANMSHEIRTPMNGVVGMVDILMQMEQPIEQRRMVQSIRNSSFSLLRIIDDILDASKIEAGKLSLEHIPVNLGGLAEGVVSAIVPGADESRVRLILFIDPRLPAWIQSDPTRLRQVLMNLLSNAVKFSRPRSGGALGSVSLRLEYQTEDWMRIVVLDNGIGMSREALGNLFKPFSQAEESTTRRFGGTGLGLVITGNLVEMMGGHIEVESEPGQGATFTVSLPLVVAQGRSLDPDISGISVLALVDQNMNQSTISAYIAQAGGQIRYAKDAAELVSMAAADAEAIIMLSLPTMRENQEVCKRVNAVVPHVRSLFFTSERAERLGMVAPRHYVVQRFPVLPSEFKHGLAVLHGRESPEVAFEGSDLQPLMLASVDVDSPLILVVEDNETNQEVITQQLQLLGYRSELAVDGQQGLERWRSGNFDLVLTDCHMPVMDGFEMVRAIRQIEQESGRMVTPIIAITANALQGEAERCKVAGMDDYLSKPVELQRLSQMLKRWLFPQTPQELALQTSTTRPLPASEIPQRSSAAPVNPSAMVEMFGMEDKALFKRIMKSFMEKSAPDVQRLREALKRDEREAVVALAHKMKSASRSIGGVDLAELCEYIELQGRAGKLRDHDQLGQEMDARFQAVCEYIDDYTRVSR